MNRRTFLKRSLGSLLTLVGLSGGTYFYAREIEPSLLTITEESITSPQIPAAFNQFKIVQFSDTHLGFHYEIEQLESLVSKINNLKPDIILFTGDLVDDPNNYHWNDKLIQLLQQLDAPEGKFWIYGNHDHGGYGTDILHETFEAADFKLLQNSSSRIQRKDASFILAGLDDAMLGNPDISRALEERTDSDFTILLAHEPDLADTVKNYPVDIQLSGHSHGGQVRLPFIGDLYTPAYAEKYVQGKYTISDKLTLYVNSGIGTTRLPYRFLCRPELHVFTLHSS
ncbi:metallophosphoesterase [Oceanobacillus neutriphilus]|uniref:Metallophosphoesterase n=1 Tax=Oceanobacillus neutriphilus TaxID=531815 RepID=A0ABQ2P047_9BACI|nr:metallophosphoesterase [Oceanobacillus neutriphilus]GGP14608.1 metallophosphoesterase [Oceanobacillus neutriphilus]